MRFKDLNAGDWFILDGEIYQKDDLEDAVRFNDGVVWSPESHDIVTFIKSVELIYD